MVVNDPCGIVCIIVTYLAIFYADYVVTRWIVLQSMPNRQDIYQLSLFSNTTFTFVYIFANNPKNPLNCLF